MSRPRPRGRLGGLAGGLSRPTPGGRLGGVQAHTWGVQAQGCVSQHALRQTPPADGYCCRRYTSYWNAFLLNSFTVIFKPSVRLVADISKCR